MPATGQMFAEPIAVEALPNSVKSAGWRNPVQETPKSEKVAGCKSAVGLPNCVKSAVGQTPFEDALGPAYVETCSIPPFNVILRPGGSLLVSSSLRM